MTRFHKQTKVAEVKEWGWLLWGCAEGINKGPPNFVFVFSAENGDFFGILFSAEKYLRTFFVILFFGLKLMLSVVNSTENDRRKYVWR